MADVEERELVDKRRLELAAGVAKAFVEAEPESERDVAKKFSQVIEHFKQDQKGKLPQKEIDEAAAKAYERSGLSTPKARKQQEFGKRTARRNAG